MRFVKCSGFLGVVFVLISGTILAADSAEGVATEVDFEGSGHVGGEAVSMGLGEHQVIRNGDFADVLFDWGINPFFGHWLPFDAEEQAVSFARWLPEGNKEFDGGSVIYQPLNIPLHGSEQLQFSMELKRPYFWAPEGATIAVYLEYIDSEKILSREKILHVPNQEVSSEEWTTFSVAHFVPSGMSRLVTLSLDMEGEVNTLARNVSLNSPVGGGPLPQVGKVEPAKVAYEEPFMIHGANLGSQEGEILIGGSGDGVEILQWSDTAVQVRLSDPCTGGRIALVTAEGVPTWQKRAIRLTSPYYRADIRPTAADMNPLPVEAMPGQEVQAAVFLGFFNGYTPGESIALSFPDESIVGHFQYPEVSGQGGSIVTVNTTGWEPGLHYVAIEAADGINLPREVFFPIEIKQVAQAVLMFDSDVPLDGMAFTAQGRKNVWVNYYDDEGDPVHGLWMAPVQLSSSHPGAIQTFNTPGPWGGLDLLVHDSAEDVKITLTLPDGRSFVATVSASIPESPRITGSGFSQPTMSNLPGYELDPQENQNTFIVSATDSISSFSVSYPFGIEGSQFTGSGANRGFSFFIAEGVNPGRYLWTAGGRVDGESLRTARVLNVVNDPATGLISGKAVEFGGGDGHGVEGSLEFYDADSGELIEVREVISFDAIDSYTVSRVPPGEYRLRWLSHEWAMVPHLPQWYPNAATFEEAETVVVAGGSEHLNIDFLMFPPKPLEIAPPFASPPGYNPVEGQFSIQIEAEENVEYVLERSYTMKENSWVGVASAWGWDGKATLMDTSATASSGFYRVRRAGP